MCNLSAILHTIVVMITIQQKGMRIKNSYVSYVNTVKGFFPALCDKSKLLC